MTAAERHEWEPARAGEPGPAGRDGQPTGMLLAGRRALVTGGTRGIGRDISLALAQAGADVLACYLNDSASAARLRDDLAKVPGNHAVIQADVTCPEDVERLVSECRERLGALDVVVNNAGAISHVPFAELTLQEWQRVVDANLTGAFLVIRTVLPMLGTGASIISIGSRAAAAGIPLRAHYTAAKAGLVGLTRSLGKELGPLGIRVNVVAPGVIWTEEWEKADTERVAELRARYDGLTALRRLGQGDEVADVVVFLASDLSRYITGETVNVDGGI